MEQSTKKMCKNHPGKEAIMRSDGVSTGLCAECLTARAKKGGRRKKENCRWNWPPFIRIMRAATPGPSR